MNLTILADYEITITFISLACLLLGALVIGKLFEKIQAPKVVGEIIGGMLFGGTFLTAVAPKLMENIFCGYAEQGKVLNIFYQLGLCLLMFSSGYNTSIDLKKDNRKIFSGLFIGSTIIPMLLGAFCVKPFESYFIGSANNSMSFFLVFLIGVAITSIPVISKIFFDMNIMNTRFANVVLTASTLQDLCLWVLLNTAIDVANSAELNIVSMLIVIAITLGSFLIVKFISDGLKKLKLKTEKLPHISICLITVMCLVAALSFLKINIMYSAFLAGYLLKGIFGNDEEAGKSIKCIMDFAFAFFIPIYFALVGIQLNLLNNFSLIRFIAFFGIAFALEWIGTVLVLALTTKLKKSAVFNFGITMNARGGPGIVLATVAYNYGIINIEFFTVLILTTMLSSTIAGYWLRLQQKKDETIFEVLEK